MSKGRTFGMIVIRLNMRTATLLLLGMVGTAGAAPWCLVDVNNRASCIGDPLFIDNCETYEANLEHWFGSSVGQLCREAIKARRDLFKVVDVAAAFESANTACQSELSFQKNDADYWVVQWEKERALSKKLRKKCGSKCKKVR